MAIEIVSFPINSIVTLVYQRVTLHHHPTLPISSPSESLKDQFRTHREWTFRTASEEGLLPTVSLVLDRTAQRRFSRLPLLGGLVKHRWWIYTAKEDYHQQVVRI